MYQRYQAYLDFFKSDQRMKGAGFVKWIMNDSHAKVVVSVNNAPIYSRTDFNVFILGTKFSIGEIRIDCGRGCFESEVPLSFLEKNGIHPMDIAGIEVIFGADCLCRAQWKENVLKVDKASAVMRAAQEPMLPERPYMEKTETMKTTETNPTVPPVQIFEPVLQAKPESADNVDSNPLKEAVLKEEAAEDLADSALQYHHAPQKPTGERWAAIVSVLPREDKYCISGQKEMVSLTPKDISLINHKYLNLTQNSFLLHGFYNYKKLMLARHTSHDAETYYLGVPGNYYDREIKLAKMFGFDFFEDEAAMKNVPKEEGFTQNAGDFGYYWKEVEI